MVPERFLRIRERMPSPTFSGIVTLSIRRSASMQSRRRPYAMERTNPSIAITRTISMRVKPEDREEGSGEEGFTMEARRREGEGRREDRERERVRGRE